MRPAHKRQRRSSVTSSVPEPGEVVHSKTPPPRFVYSPHPDTDYSPVDFAAEREIADRVAARAKAAAEFAATVRRESSQWDAEMQRLDLQLNTLAGVKQHVTSRIAELETQKRQLAQRRQKRLEELSKTAI